MRSNSRRSRTERIFLIIYTVLALVFLAAGMSAHMFFPIALGTAPEVVFCWGLYWLQKGDRTSRAVIMTVSALVSMAFFGIMVMSMDILLPLFAVLLAMIGMFNSNLLLGLWTAETALMLLYHLFIGKSYDFSLADTYVRLFYQLVCLSVMLYLEEMKIRKNIERKRQTSDTVEFLQESVRGKEGMLCGFLRELEEPLEALRVKGEPVLEADAPEGVREAVEGMLALEARMRRSVDEMADYVETGSGKGFFKEETYSISALLADAREIITAQNMEKNPEITVECDENVPQALSGDSEGVRRAIMCLMNNAIKLNGKESVTLLVCAQKKNYGVDLCISVKGMGSGFCVVIPQRTADGEPA